MLYSGVVRIFQGDLSILLATVIMGLLQTSQIVPFFGPWPDVKARIIPSQIAYPCHLAPVLDLSFCSEINTAEAIELTSSEFPVVHPWVDF